MYFKVNFDVRSRYRGPFLSILVRSGAFRSIPVSKRTRKNGIVSNFTLNVKDQSNLMKVGKIYLSISMSFFYKTFALLYYRPVIDTFYRTG